MPANERGRQALATVKQKFGTLGGVQSAFGALDNDGMPANCQSCNTTSSLVMKALFGKASPKTEGIFPLSVEGRVERIDALLRGDHIVYIAISPDHHFVVIPTADDRVSIVQGFQGSYSINEWLANRNDGDMSLADFIANLGALTIREGDDRQNAAVALFGWEAVNDGVRSYFNQKTEIKVAAYHPTASLKSNRSCCVIM